MRLIYGKYTGVRARRVLVFDTSAALRAADKHTCCNRTFQAI